MAQEEQHCESHPNTDHDPFRKQFYFFYGTLMDSSTLATVLNLQDRPQLFPAKILGYKCMLWDQYPALLDDGPPGAPVYGLAYKVQSREDRERLKTYEGDHYKLSPCLIQFEDREVVGSTFKWDADVSLLRGGSSFDLEDWQTSKLGL